MFGHSLNGFLGFVRGRNNPRGSFGAMTMTVSSPVTGGFFTFGFRSMGLSLFLNLPRFPLRRLFFLLLFVLRPIFGNQPTCRHVLTLPFDGSVVTATMVVMLPPAAKQQTQDEKHGANGHKNHQRLAYIGRKFESFFFRQSFFVMSHGRYFFSSLFSPCFPGSKPMSLRT